MNRSEEFYRVVKQLVTNFMLLTFNLKYVEGISKIIKIIRSHKQMTAREISSECSIFYGPYQTILTENLCMRKVYAKIVSKLLFGDQNTRRFEVDNLNERA